MASMSDVCVLLLMVACFGLGPDARGTGRVSLLVAAPAVCSPTPTPGPCNTFPIQIEPREVVERLFDPVASEKFYVKHVFLLGDTRNGVQAERDGGGA
jgi:hypothetical protein